MPPIPRLSSWGAPSWPPGTRVTLFSDLAHSTSNSIYRKLGYQPLRDFRHYMFETQGA